MKVIGQSIVKANNDVFDKNIFRNNEDALHKTENWVAISDGAGGVGILADKWAKTLVNNIPSKPFENADGIDKWIGSFWKNFYTDNKKSIGNDPWRIKKFDEEGSLATLSIVWQVSEYTYQYVAYGDSAMFVYNRNTGKLKIQRNLSSINSFTSHPPLINWRTEKLLQKYFYEEELNLGNNEEIILATDGMAMYIFAAYLVHKNELIEDVKETKMLKIVDYFCKHPIHNFKQWIMNLKGALITKETFTQLTQEWHQNRFLPNDDYTLVWIENN